MSFFLRYVPHSRVNAFEAIGWRVVSNGKMLATNHGLYSVLMRWDGQGDPPEPTA